jgi:predicted nuclease with TOPRIM domain
MDEVQRFIANNQHQFGYIMQEASRQWIANNPSGALTVGPCNIYIEKYGDYHTLQDKVERQQKEIEGYIDDVEQMEGMLRQANERIKELEKL